MDGLQPLPGGLVPMLLSAAWLLCIPKVLAVLLSSSRTPGTSLGHILVARSGKQQPGTYSVQVHGKVKKYRVVA